MQIRMLPISFAFNRFPRIVHDLSRKLGKKVELKLIGEGTELDKTVLEKINDPLVHLVATPRSRARDAGTAPRRGQQETRHARTGAFHEAAISSSRLRDDGAVSTRRRYCRRLASARSFLRIRSSTTNRSTT